MLCPVWWVSGYLCLRDLKRDDSVFRIFRINKSLCLFSLSLVWKGERWEEQRLTSIAIRRCFLESWGFTELRVDSGLQRVWTRGCRAHQLPVLESQGRQWFSFPELRHCRRVTGGSQDATSDAWARKTSITYSPFSGVAALSHLPDVTYFRQCSVSGGLCKSDHSYCREDSYSERILDFRWVSFVQSFVLLGGKCRRKAEPILNKTEHLRIRPTLRLWYLLFCVLLGSQTLKFAPSSSSSFQIPLTSPSCPFQTKKSRYVVLQLLERTGCSFSPEELSLFHTHKPQALLILVFYPWVNQGKERKWPPPQEPQTPTGPGSHVKLQKVQ